MEEASRNSLDGLIQKIRQDTICYEHRNETGNKLPYDSTVEAPAPDDLDYFRQCRKWKESNASRVLAESTYFGENESITILVDFISRWYQNKISTPDQCFQNSDQVHYHSAHCHEFFEISYLFSGECFFKIEEDEYDMQAGQLWINNVQVHHSVCLVGQETNLINILVRKSTLEQHLIPLLRGDTAFLRFFTQSIYNTTEGPSCLQFYVSEGSSVQMHLYDIIKEHVERDKYSQQIMLFSFCSLLLELSRQYKRIIRYGLDGQQGQLAIEKLLLYISDHFDTVTLESMSQYFNYSAEHISRMIARETGKSFTRWRLKYRMQRAYDLLKTTELPIELIAQKVGYSERWAFESAFKRYFKQTPHQLRKLQ